MKLTLHLFLFLTIFSCAAMKEARQNWLAANCNQDAAYSIGVEDASNDEKHQSWKFDDCPTENVGTVKMGYSKGYNSIKNNPLNIIQDLAGLSYYQCTVSAFGSDYIGSSNNLGKAKVAAIDKCKKKNHSMHCSDVECEKVR